MQIRHHRTRARVFALVLVMGLIAAACSNDDKAATTSTTKGGSGTNPSSNPNKGFNEAQFSGTPQLGGKIAFGVESNIATLDPAANLAQPSDIDMSLAI